MTALTEFLFPTPARRSAVAIVGWWESRRLAFNLIVGGTGLFTLSVVSGIHLLPVGPALFRMGLTFGVGLTLLPALLSIIGWVAAVVFTFIL